MGSTEVAEGVSVSGRILDGSQRDEKGTVNGSRFTVWRVYRLKWTRFGMCVCSIYPSCLLYISVYSRPSHLEKTYIHAENVEIGSLCQNLLEMMKGYPNECLGVMILEWDFDFHSDDW